MKRTLVGYCIYCKGQIGKDRWQLYVHSRKDRIYRTRNSVEEAVTYFRQVYSDSVEFKIVPLHTFETFEN